MGEWKLYRSDIVDQRLGAKRSLICGRSLPDFGVLQINLPQCDVGWNQFLPFIWIPYNVRKPRNCCVFDFKAPKLRKDQRIPIFLYFLQLGGLDIKYTTISWFPHIA